MLCFRPGGIWTQVPGPESLTSSPRPMTTAAAIDRLVHHSVILELNIPSYRLEQAKKATDLAAKAGDTPGRPRPEPAAAPGNPGDL